MNIDEPPWLCYGIAVDGIIPLLIEIASDYKGIYPNEKQSQIVIPYILTKILAENF